MNKNKISPKLLNEVSVMEQGKTDSVLLSSSDFWKTKKFLDKYKKAPNPDCTAFYNVDGNCEVIEAEEKE